jgi:hypothetical protein
MGTMAINFCKQKPADRTGLEKRRENIIVDWFFERRWKNGMKKQKSKLKI